MSALEFVHDRLGVKDAVSRKQSEPRRLLDEISTAFQTQLPFNNLNLLRSSPENRRRPSDEELKTRARDGVGGLCYDINIAAFFVLKHLGFNVYLAFASCGGFPDNHVVAIARDVERSGDNFLVDAALGFPMFRAVDLDFPVESPTFTDSFLEYKFVKRGGKLLRLHGKGDSGGNPKFQQEYVDGWRVMYKAELSSGVTPNVEEFYSRFDEVYGNPALTPFHSKLLLAQFPGRRLVAINDQKLMLEKDSGELEINTIEGGDEGILAAIRRYFPTIPEELAREALASWRSATASS